MIEPEFNSDGYPTKETLKTIRQWSDYTPDGQIQLLDFVRDAWSYPERVERMVISEENKTMQYNFSTGGWSGNEDIIDALNNNVMAWMLCWHSSSRGGHYVFQVGRIGD